MVLFDDGRHIEGESAEVINPAADPLTVAAARAAVGVILGHRAAGQADGRPTSDVDAPTEAVAAVAARAAGAAQGQVFVQRAAGVACASGQYGEAAAPASTRFCRSANR